MLVLPNSNGRIFGRDLGYQPLREPVFRIDTSERAYGAEVSNAAEGKRSVAATLNDIARQTNTSVSTVSRVLAGGSFASRISDETRTRVMHAAKQMGYRPNLLARGLRTRKTHTVALLVSDIANPFFGQIASLVEQQLHRHGYSLIVCNSGEDPDLEDEYLNLLPSKGIDGLILVPLVRGKRSLGEVLSKNLPLVVLDRPIPGIGASVSSDQDQATNALCDTLERANVKRVALVSGPQNVFTQRRRSEVVAKRFDVIFKHEGPMQYETGRHAFVSSLGQTPDAVVCTNNFLAMGYLDSIEEIENPPVMGVFEEIPLMQLLQIPIVCAIQDIPMLAESCVQQLLPQLNGMIPEHIEPVLLPARVVTNLAFKRWQERQ
jgi:LacI family transcriptional regulator